MKKSVRRPGAGKLPPAAIKFLRVRQYADRIGISERTLREWIYAGVIPIIKVKDHLILIDPVRADAALQRLERKEVEA
jgi:predicted site-specific integrase-resolvase